MYYGKGMRPLGVWNSRKMVGRIEVTMTFRHLSKDANTLIYMWEGS